MAISHDVTTTSAAAYTSTGTQNTTHAGGASAKGAVVMIVQNASTSNQVSGVTYGGAAMTFLRFDTNTSETGGVYIYWLSGIATGSQTVAMTTTGTASKRLVVSTMNTGGGGIAVGGNNSAAATGTNPTVTVSGLNTSTTYLGYLAIHSGLQTMTTTPGTGWTNILAVDLGSQGIGFARRTAVDTGVASLVCNWTAATSEDYRITGVLFYEIVPTNQTLYISSISYNISSNPSFEVNTSTWTTSNSTIARVTTGAYSGVGCLEVTCSVAGGTYSGAISISGMTIGDRYSFSAWLKNGAGAAKNAAVYVSQITTYGNQIALDGTWRQSSIEWTATAATTFLYVIQSSVGAIGQSFYADSIDVQNLTGGIGDPLIINSIASRESWGFLRL